MFYNVKYLFTDIQRCFFSMFSIVESLMAAEVEINKLHLLK